MSKKIKNRLYNVLKDGLSTYKQYLANELQTHDKHLDGDDYCEFMHMYIWFLTAEIEHAKLTLKLTEDNK